MMLLLILLDCVHRCWAMDKYYPIIDYAVHLYINFKVNIGKFEATNVYLFN
jgi:hypothetical protein